MITCKNCGEEVTGRFCSNCGQKRDTKPLTFASILRTAISTITELDRGFLYNLKYLTIDFKETVLGYLDGKRIRVYNPISYALIGVSVMLLVSSQFGKSIDPGGPSGAIAQQDSFSFGFEYGKFITANIKYIWLLGIVFFALPARLFYRQRRLTEHMAIQAFVIGHSCFICAVLFLLWPIRFPANPILLVVMLALMIWVYWKMDREMISPVFSPFIFLFGLVMLIVLPMPFFAMYQKISDKPIKQEIVAQGLKHPWSIAFLDDSTALVNEKDGVLKKVNLSNGMQINLKGIPPDLVTDIRSVDERDNAGLFEVLLDPDFVTNDWVYLSYAAQVEGNTTTKVVRAKLNQDSLSEMQTLLEVLPASSDRFHYGGGMVFDKTNKLIVSVGERFYNEKDQPDWPVSQNPKDARGMIYRINRDGSIPDSNPDFGPDAVPGAYAIGIRATQGMAMNPKDQQIWFTDHGSVRGDEINILEAGANYGWPIETTGDYRNEDYTPPPKRDSTYKKPVWYCIETTAPTGLTFYSGEALPQYKNHLFIAGLSKGSLWAITMKKNYL
ncbi:MAG: PQQ-dependent sugar dehydrogenase, partial [Bacteroidota bacterium]